MTTNCKIRIGNGYDIHRLEPGRPLMLGGVNVPWIKGLLGHSDADVLVHAIMDAMLGALSLGDIGQHFPPIDPKYKDINSLELLKHVHSLIKNTHSVVNIDSIIIAEKPKLVTYIPDMCATIAKALEIDINLVSVKATTMEGLGPIGQGEAIAASAVVLLNQLN